MTSKTPSGLDHVLEMFRSRQESARRSAQVADEIREEVEDIKVDGRGFSLEYRRCLTEALAAFVMAEERRAEVFGQEIAECMKIMGDP